MHNKTICCPLYFLHEVLALCLGCRVAGKSALWISFLITLSLRGHPFFCPCATGAPFIGKGKEE
jgi:hypothetical protein